MHASDLITDIVEISEGDTPILGPARGRSLLIEVKQTGASLELKMTQEAARKLAEQILHYFRAQAEG